MVFASITFLYIFLPLNLILYYISKNPTYRNILLTAFSFIFYAWGEPVWITLLIFSATIDYFNAKLIERNRGTRYEKLGLISSIVINLSLLVAFKYSGFLYENFNAVFSTDFTPPKFSLPIGISFYTFQTISYVVDVYRKRVKVQQDYSKFLMFVSLYHQLVAGPIVRYAHIANEIDNRKFNIRDISAGFGRFSIGLFKKVCIANVAGELASGSLDGSFDALSVGEGWFGMIMFSIQIYFDFSGYSDMAIGLGRMFGFHYHENFKYPYISKSATEFWRRWHISLGTFFRDYVYIPLGGNRKRFYLNLLIVWFLTGMWHGASWNYIFWGVYFGVLIAIEKAFLIKLLKKIPSVVSHFYLLFAAVFGWVLFYFEDLGRLGSFIRVIFGFGGNEAWNYKVTDLLTQNLYWFIFAIILCMPVFPKVWRIVLRKTVAYNKPTVAYSAFLLINLIMLFIATTMLVGNSYNPFIYYRF